MSIIVLLIQIDNCSLSVIHLLVIQNIYRIFALNQRNYVSYLKQNKHNYRITIASISISSSASSSTSSNQSSWWKQWYFIKLYIYIQTTYSNYKIKFRRNKVNWNKRPLCHMAHLKNSSCIMHSLSKSLKLNPLNIL